jgi:DNA-binding CsgD family transcriptional regulator
MYTLALWVNIIAFAVMLSSIGLTVVIRRRRAHPWLRFYLAYALGYAAWTLLFSAAFFNQIYESVPRVWMSSVVAWLRPVVSGIIMSALAFMIAGISGSDRSRRLLRRLGITLGPLFALFGITTYFVPSFVLGATVNLAYNVIAGTLVLLGLRFLSRRRRGAAQALLRPFLLVSLVFYLLVAILGAILLFVAGPAPLLSAFAVAAYCLPWALVMIARQTSYLGEGSDGMAAPSVPEAFAADYELTPREREVAAAVLGGASNAGIAEEQHVSLKTVEAHLYRIYRKTGVRNRVGLVNRVAAYRNDPPGWDASRYEG